MLLESGKANPPSSLDWVEVAKLAGKYGIRYPTNEAMKAFLAKLEKAKR